jgi:hypothetical protein
MGSSEEGLHVVPANRVGHGEQLASTNARGNSISLVASQIQSVMAIAHLAVKDIGLDLPAGHPCMGASWWSMFAEKR